MCGLRPSISRGHDARAEAQRQCAFRPTLRAGRVQTHGDPMATPTAASDDQHSSYVATGTAPLVGRRPELDWLARRLGAAVAGQPQVVLVHGDTGIGKSRLVRELAQRAQADGVTVATGRCRDELALPYLPLTQSLFRVIAPVIESEGAGGQALLSALVDGSMPATSDGLPDDHERLRLFAEVARATLQVVARQPLLLVIDDVHWIDQPSFELLRHLVMEVGDAAIHDPVRLMIVLTYRPELNEDLTTGIARLRREEICSDLELRGLGQAESAELARQLGLAGADHETLASVHDVTVGNALFIEAVVREARRRGSTGALAPADVVMPQDLSDAVGATIGRLPAATREVIARVAVLGDQASRAEAIAISGVPEDVFDAAVAEGVGAGAVDVGPDGIRITHPLYGQLLRSGMTPAERGRAHLEAAEVIERRDPDARRDIEVARHLIDAGDAADTERVFPAARLGGEQAAAIFAWSDAARCFSAAAEIGERAGEPLETVAQLHHQAGHALHFDRHAGAARRHLSIAIDRFREAGDIRGLALALGEQSRVELLAGGFGEEIDVSELDALLDELEALDPLVAARILADRSEIAWARDDISFATELATRSLRIADDVGDDEAAVHAQISLAIIAWARLDLRDALARLTDARERARDAAQPWLADGPAPRLALTLLWLGRLDEADAIAVEACDHARQTGDWPGRALALAARLGVAVARGDHELADALGDEAWLTLRFAEYGWSTALVLPVLASDRIARGDLAEASTLLERWRSVGAPAAQSQGFGLLVSAAEQLVRMHDDASFEVPGRLDALIAHWPARIGSVIVPAVLAELAPAEVGQLADDLATALGSIEDTGMVLTDGLLHLIPRVRGLAEARAGRPDQARMHLERAIDLAERIGARAEGARARLDLARLLARESDETAPTVARDAASELRSLEMLRFARAAEALVPSSSTARTPTSAPVAVAAVIVFTDLVDSTGLTERIGDLAYRTLADELLAGLLAAIDTCNGELIPGITLGDGVLALFSSARDAIAFGEHAHPAAIRLGVQIRVGIHAGDVLRIGDIVSGGAVNIAARVCATALPAETLVSQTVRGVARTSAGVTFEDRGEHELRGVSEPQRLFAVLTGAEQ